MPPAIIAAGIGAAGAIGGGLLASSGAHKAANIQSAADQQAIAEQQRQFNVTDQELSPFRTAGVSDLTGYQNLLGANGAAPSAAAIQALQASPYYQSLYRNGQEAVLQNASATGGLRGGNTQRGLADFGSDTLAQTIQNQLGYLGAGAQLGLGATNSTGAFGASAANNIAGLTVNSGQSQSDAALAQAGAISGIFKNLGSLGAAAVNPTGFLSGGSGIGNSGGITVTPGWGQGYNSGSHVGGF